YTPSGHANHADTAWDAKLSKDLPYEINLIHINPLELGTAYCRIDPHAFDYRYHIAFWLWELEDFPDEWTMYFEGLDEIWAPSEFTCEAIRKKTSLPVKCMPYYLEASVQGTAARQYFQLPDGQFLFLMMYDSRSCAERKNPEAVMRAFQKAFAPSDRSVGLAIKINHATKEDERYIQNIMNGYTNIYLIKNPLDRNEVNHLIRCVDVVVSLHRAEGFGLVLAEAMLLGTPVIATNWSANTEFMNKEVACMVDYQLVTLQKELPPFHAGCRWAEPDVSQAADYMKKLREDSAYADELAQTAKRYIENKLSMQQAAGRMKDRIEEICRELEKHEKNRNH
ncbi:MAG: glycosyltransferase, partial [Eubacterium sp.]|nr:glycosyltransferase [Eubacterium sp.]